jgi:hypothetical protein
VLEFYAHSLSRNKSFSNQHEIRTMQIRLF